MQQKNATVSIYFVLFSNNLCLFWVCSCSLWPHKSYSFSYSFSFTFWKHSLTRRPNNSIAFKGVCTYFFLHRNWKVRWKACIVGISGFYRWFFPPKFWLHLKLWHKRSGGNKKITAKMDNLGVSIFPHKMVKMHYLPLLLRGSI